MRSASIRNKFLVLDIPLNPPGTVSKHSGLDISGDIISIPEPGLEFPRIQEYVDRFAGINKKLEDALPPTLATSETLQSFWPLEQGDNGGGAYD
jgi:hypothetical protein